MCNILVKAGSIWLIPKRNVCHFSHYYNFLEKTQLNFIYTGLPQVREENFKVKEFHFESGKLQPHSQGLSFSHPPLLTPGGPWKVDWHFEEKLGKIEIN